MSNPFPRWWDRLRWNYYGVYYGVRNLVRWFPVVWHDDDGDHVYLLILMRHKMLAMAEHHESGRIVAGWKHTAKQLRVCAELCRRLQSNTMGKYVGYDRDTYDSWPQWKQRRLWKRAEASFKWHEQYLGTLIAKHLRTWWD